jgi:hypothetical protein
MITWTSNYRSLDMHRYVQVKYQCHSASIIVAEISMITLVMILGAMVPSIPQDGEKVRQRVYVEATRPVSYVPLLPFDPPCVFEILVRHGASGGASGSFLVSFDPQS